jgi:hypothetical protein
MCSVVVVDILLAVPALDLGNLAVGDPVAEEDNFVEALVSDYQMTAVHNYQEEPFSSFQYSAVHSHRVLVFFLPLKGDQNHLQVHCEVHTLCQLFHLVGDLVEDHQPP